MAFADQWFTKGASTLWQRINERRLWHWIAFAAVGSLAIATWLFWPIWPLNGYVRIPASSLSLLSRIDCMPVRLDLVSATSYAELRRARLTLTEKGAVGAQSLAEYPLTFRLAERQRYTAILSAADTKKANDSLRKAQSHVWIASLEFARLPFLDIRSIDISYDESGSIGNCAKETLTGASLRDRIVGTSAKLMYYSLMQDKLSDIVFSVNEVAGNILLCVLLLAVLWLINSVVAGWRLVYWVQDGALSIIGEPNTSLSSEQRRISEERIISSHRTVFLNLAFLRIIGPATGFLLTVSSLIAGLHPSATAAQDTFRFISSLQLALVATLMGLTMRVLAEFAIRLHRNAVERKLELLAKIASASET